MAYKNSNKKMSMYVNNFISNLAIIQGTISYGLQNFSL